MIRACAIALLAAIPAVAADTGDWPGFRGSDRTGLSAETGLLKEWPVDGPKLAWKISGLGGGLSTPSIADGRIYLLGSKGGDEYLIGLEEKDGKRAWELKIGKEAGGHPGPRSTPTIDAGFAYVISSDGMLVCADLKKNGSLKWKKDFKADFGGRTGNWAYAESPLIDGETLVCSPGGPEAAIVALKKSDGSVIWKSKVEKTAADPKGAPKGKGKSRDYGVAAYSSAIVAEIAGVRQYINFLNGGLVSVAAKDGKLLWTYDAAANGTANCSPALVSGDLVFAASAYKNGGGQVKVTKTGDTFTATQQYFAATMQNHHGGMVLVKDHVYGTNANSLVCMEFKTGKIAWEDRSVGKGSVIFADGHLYVRGEGGKVALVEAIPGKYSEKSQFTPPERSGKEPAWPHPVIAGGKLYLREWDLLFCYDIKAK